MTSTAGPSYSPRPSTDIQLRITHELREFVLIALWVGVTFVQFPGDELLLYPLALYFAYSIFRDRMRLIPFFLKGWPLFLFPLWCLLSVIWAVEPVATLKHAIYLMLTIMICFLVALHLPPRRIILAVLLATGIIGVLSFVVGIATGNVRIGIFLQKNSMGINMVVLWTVASAVFLDRRCSVWVRSIALALAALAFYLVIASQSATAMLLALATGSINFFGALLLRGHFLRPQRLAAAFAILAVVTSTAAVVLPTYQDDPVEQVLGAFNKDTTLTGRTGLWNYARNQIREEPYLGVGAGGFWRYNHSPLVRRIYEEYHKNPRDYFNFHNSYFEISVHQGLIGLGLAMIAMLWAAGWILRGAFVLGGLPHVMFFTQSLAVTVRTMTESDFLRPFVLFHMLFWIGALCALRAVRERDAKSSSMNP